MKTTYLLKYETKNDCLFCSYTNFYLFTETVWFFGLFKTNNKLEYRIWDHQNFKTFFDHWNNLIQERKPLNNLS